MTSTENETIPTRWEWHYRVLNRLRKALLRHRAELSSAMREPSSTDSNDRADAATEDSERDIFVRELNTDGMELTEVEAALERMRRGTYGLCEETGVPISEARLRTLPWTRFSLEAAKRHDTRKSGDASSTRLSYGPRHG